MHRRRRQRGSTGPRGAKTAGNGGALVDFVRNSHIFSSAVREVLEERPLREVCREPVTVSQFHLLRLLALNGHHLVGEAAEFLGISPPAATKNIDKLEKLGLLARAAAPGDRRAALLVVTPRGRRLVNQYDRLKSRRLAELLEELKPDEVAGMARILERLSLLLYRKGMNGDGMCLRCAAYIRDGCPVGRLRGGCPYQQRRWAHAAAHFRGKGDGPM